MSFLRFLLPRRPDLAELRGVVDDLPLPVRLAMLRGVGAERIIAGGYTDDHGGVCPMLAAHRHGGRWSHPDFARTWDEFAEAPVEGLREAAPERVEDLAHVLRASIEVELRAEEPEDVTAGEQVRRHPGSAHPLPRTGRGVDALESASPPGADARNLPADAVHP